MLTETEIAEIDLRVEAAKWYEISPWATTDIPRLLSGRRELLAKIEVLEAELREQVGRVKEAAAQVAEKYRQPHFDTESCWTDVAAKEIAAAIRAMGEK